MKANRTFRGWHIALAAVFIVVVAVNVFLWCRLGHLADQVEELDQAYAEALTSLRDTIELADVPLDETTPMEEPVEVLRVLDID